ncbi:hypothetical protein IW262DRAFT_1299262 [Armillaria fumosa]|nr:hypothetical protein IW262DRAFT_1299262 [Armillaria fumosa]
MSSSAGINATISCYRFSAAYLFASCHISFSRIKKISSPLPPPARLRRSANMRLEASDIQIRSCTHSKIFVLSGVLLYIVRSSLDIHIFDMAICNFSRLQDYPMSNSPPFYSNQEGTMPQQESVLLRTHYNIFMSIFKRIKRAIASWLLEPDSDSEAVEHKQKQSAVLSNGDTPSSAAPELNRLVPIYSHESGAIVGYVTHGSGTPQSIPSAMAIRPETNPHAPVPPAQHRNRGPTRFQDPHSGVPASDKPKLLSLPFSPSTAASVYPSLESLKSDVPHDFTRWPDNDLSDPAPLIAYIPLEIQPEPEAQRGTDDGVIFTALSQIPGRWNGWPSGLFAMDISVEDLKQTEKLQVNWATRGNGGDPDGSETASKIHDGKISNR